MEGNSRKEKSSGITDELIAAFLDGNVNGEEMEAVASALADDAVLTELMTLSSVIDKDVEQNKRRILPMRALAAANPENLCSFECEAYILRRFDFDVDHWSLLEEAKANNWICEDGTPLHHVGKLLELKGLYVERKYDSSPIVIQEALNERKYVVAIVDNNIIVGKKDSPSPAFHALCITKIDSEEGCKVWHIDPSSGKERFVEGEDFIHAWKASGHYMVAASLEPNGYNPQPINVEDIDLDADLEDLTEAIAENAHDIWARARMDEGWTYGSVRDDARKLHPDLVPYSMLPESEKEYDRIMAMNTLRLVRRLGYDIINGKNSDKTAHLFK